MVQVNMQGGQSRHQAFPARSPTLPFLQSLHLHVLWASHGRGARNAVLPKYGAAQQALT